MSSRKKNTRIYQKAQEEEPKFSQGELDINKVF